MRPDVGWGTRASGAPARGSTRARMRTTGRGGGGDGSLRSGRHLGPWGTHMPEDPVSPLPDRQSVRMRGFDYAKDGAYFITICTADRRCTLGSIADGKAHAFPPLARS